MSGNDIGKPPDTGNNPRILAKSEKKGFMPTSTVETRIISSSGRIEGGYRVAQAVGKLNWQSSDKSNKASDEQSYEIREKETSNISLDNPQQYLSIATKNLMEIVDNYSFEGKEDSILGEAAKEYKALQDVLKNLKASTSLETGQRISLLTDAATDLAEIVDNYSFEGKEDSILGEAAKEYKALQDVLGNLKRSLENTNNKRSLSKTSLDANLSDIRENPYGRDINRRNTEDIRKNIYEARENDSFITEQVLCTEPEQISTNSSFPESTVVAINSDDIIILRDNQSNNMKQADSFTRTFSRMSLDVENSRREDPKENASDEKHSNRDSAEDRKNKQYQTYYSAFDNLNNHSNSENDNKIIEAVRVVKACAGPYKSYYSREDKKQSLIAEKIQKFFPPKKTKNLIDGHGRDSEPTLNPIQDLEDILKYQINTDRLIGKDLEDALDELRKTLNSPGDTTLEMTKHMLSSQSIDKGQIEQYNQERSKYKQKMLGEINFSAHDIRNILSVVDKGTRSVTDDIKSSANAIVAHARAIRTFNNFKLATTKSNSEFEDNAYNALVNIAKVYDQLSEIGKGWANRLGINEGNKNDLIKYAPTDRV